VHTANQIYIAVLLVLGLIGMFIRANLIGKEKTVTYKAHHFFYALASEFVFSLWLIWEVWPKV